MSISEIEQCCNALRQDLKTWEKKFADAHDGRKAEREDIKAEALIAQKYKEYSRLRHLLSARAGPLQSPSKRVSTRCSSHDQDRPSKAATTEEKGSSKRKHSESSAPVQDAPVKSRREAAIIHASTAAKRMKCGDIEGHLRTPQKQRLVKLSTPAKDASPFMSPAFIGPTPQRDGKALGLFDHLPQDTPSKSRSIFASIEANIVKTPGKAPNKVNLEATPESTKKWERTPMSSGKRFYLDSIVTPPKTEQGTPSSSLKNPQTPAFLRRDAYLAPIDEDHEPTPRIPAWKRMGLFRSLSVAQSFQARKQEEERAYDEEADIMRELEMEEMGGSAVKKQTLQQKLSGVQVEDSQPAMPLGPDRESETEDDGDEAEAEGQLGPDGKPRRIWKKKGLKRQTRRVNMKPHFVKPEAPPTQAQDKASDDDDSKVAETQINPDNDIEDVEFLGDDASDYASDASHSQKKAKAHKKKKVNGLADNTSTSQPRASKEDKDLLKQTKNGAVKKAARKIKATAHANYQKLKIRGKGGNGGKGRFGRKR